MYYQGIGRVFWGYLNFWDSWAFDRPSIYIVQKSATSPVWCTIQCIIREFVYFGGISMFGIPGPLTGPISTLAGTYPSLE